MEAFILMWLATTGGSLCAFLILAGIDLAIRRMQERAYAREDGEDVDL